MFINLSRLQPLKFLIKKSKSNQNQFNRVKYPLLLTCKAIIDGMASCGSEVYFIEGKTISPLTITNKKAGSLAGNLKS